MVCGGELVVWFDVVKLFHFGCCMVCELPGWSGPGTEDFSSWLREKVLLLVCTR